jgi:signal transduction histidine kinase/ligand-binding sensor domain-containing protein/DNA-binding response OmpR family regulator
MKRFLLPLALLVSLPLCAHAQRDTLAFEALPLNQGAPATVTCIFQDKIGYVWIGTSVGLHRYDGYTFVSYRHDPDDTSTLAHDWITKIFEDRAGVLWVGCLYGLDKFDRASGSFVHYVPNPSGVAGDGTNCVYQIAEAKDSTLWINTGNGLFRLDRTNSKLFPLAHDSTDPGGVPISAIHEDRKGSLWFGTARGLQRFNFDSNKFEKSWVDTLTTSSLWPSNNPGCWVNNIHEDERGVLWLATGGGLVEYDPELGTSTRFRCVPADILNPQHPQDSFSSVCQDPASGVLWVSSAQGLLSFDRQSKQFSLLTHEGISTVFVERSGTLWLGTHTGVKKLNRFRSPFRKYPTRDVACAVANADKEALWVYVYNQGGWLRFDPTKEQFVPYTFGHDYLFYAYQEGDLALLKKDGSFYIRDTLGNIIYTLGPAWKEFTHSFSFGWKTRRGYYVGTHRGSLCLLDPQTQGVKEIRQFGPGIYNLYEDHTGLLWVATYQGGVFSYDQTKGTFTQYVLESNEPSNPGAQAVNQFHEDKRGNLWIATSAGLVRFERSTNSFSYLRERAGLLSQNVRGISEDDRGFLWLNTTKGISKFNPESGEFRNYDVTYGVEPAADVYYGWACRAANGEMYFCGAHGLTRFHPDSIKENQFVPPIVLTSFRKFDKPCPIPTEIRLQYDENFISFEFAALSFVNPERNQYAYKMEGVDNEWVSSGTRRYASYPNLTPGSYVFRVKGSNNEGLWNEAGTSIAIMISPPWWKTIWAYLFYAVTLLSLGYYIWSAQVRRLRKQHEYEMTRFEAAKLHQVDEMKSRFFANISHEFRTPLTLIMGPVAEVMEESDRVEIRQKLSVAQKNARRLLGLVNQLLDLSKLESGSMKLQAAPLDIVSLVKGLSQSFISYAERKRISLTVTSSEPSVIAYIDEDKFEKILTNILSNAFKFTPEGGHIEIAVKLSPPSLISSEEKGETRGMSLHASTGKGGEFVVISISDTGIGIPADKVDRVFDRFYQVDDSHTRAQEGTGIGLSLTKELVELHKGTIEVESQEGRGTTVSMKFPLGTKHLQPGEICGHLDEEAGVSARLLVAPQPEEHVEAKARRDLAAEAEKTVVLIVEDNADVRDYVRRNLVPAYRVLDAVNGEDAWKRSLEDMPDIIVSDVMMPKLDGFELCNKLKTDERTSHIPVILLTAKASSRDKIEGLDIGADDYIMKPFDPEEVKARIHNLIEQRKRVHEHFRKHGLFEVEEQKITPVDRKFLENALAIITRHLSDSTFGVELLAEEMAVSRSLLLKKTEVLIGEPPSELIKRIRLNKAAQLIEGKFGDVTEIALEVGFNNPSYFTACFKRQFGCPPSHYHRNTASQKA